MNNARYVIGAVILGSALTALAGCTGGDVMSDPHELTVQREVNLDARTVVVIPFSETAPAGQNSAGFFQSKAGTDLAEQTAGLMRGRMAQTTFVGSLAARSGVGEEKLKAATLDELAKAAKADVVIAGNIRELKTQEPGDIAFLRGTLTLDVQVYDVKAKRNLATWVLTTKYPERGAGVAVSEMTPGEVKDKMMTKIADTLSRKFYTYKKTVGPKPIDW